MGRPALVVALTGGIGSGKSTVSRHFEKLGVPVIDADLIAREQVEPGAPALDEIRKRFGADVITPKGGLDRDRMRSIVFENSTKRLQLQQILHPRIRSEMQLRLVQLDTPYAVLVIPLLLESGQDSLADRILVVDIPEVHQIARVQQRDGLKKTQIGQIIAAQVDRQSRLAAADDVISNDGGLQTLEKAVEQLHQRYLDLAEQRSISG
ncbi:MAG: dephospho-CoA kinase [Gammaproteobacteria bacterium (ex Lamellibrachia satsuma)]|nr:MAG: dephospho-CoA kinase [Gammaproteobacteria bacterium (ex Lamellibrachia satsuma)]RRS31466.1 MAG: dephospho-CoA kinase [Gammaproteobacteria bacterium (ex Lamellibrachia satsuma)]RRS33443.1 MAG: dephospho-CoA kinase [Gammaproteobacteria bacterium (ex Lamellibrachia satsuma)]